MKKADSYLWIFLLSASCGQEQTSTITQDPNANFLPSGTVSFVQSTPAHDTTEVALDTYVKMQFSGPINPSSLSDGTSVTIVDDMGSRIPGAITYDSGSHTATWIPQVSGRALYLNAFTHYHVTLNGITDAQSLIIAPWDFDFYTKQVNSSTGKFHITYVGKQRKDDGSAFDSYDSILLPHMGLEVQFSERVFENSPGCSDTRWSDAFQIINADLGNAVGASGQVCLVCRSVPGDSVCDTLRFKPAKPWINGSGLIVNIRPSLTLKGVSGEPLQSGGSAKLFVFPNLASIFQ